MLGAVRKLTEAVAGLELDLHKVSEIDCGRLIKGVCQVAREIQHTFYQTCPVCQDGDVVSRSNSKHNPTL